jgi:cysteine desulfurase
VSGQICYFDNNATTRLAPAVVEAMLPFLSERWGNPSSLYGFGHDLNRPLAEARAKVAALINAEATEIIFTSCGTESINSVLRSAVATQPGKRHIVTTAVEHSATLNCCRFLETQGCSATYLPVNAYGALDLALLEHSIRQDTALVSVMSANNETGLLFPVAEIAALCHEKGVPFHTDAVQMAGKLRLDVRELDVDFLSLSAHKLHAPKGIGALYVKRGTHYQPYLIGGGQEAGRRGGTENVAGIVGFGRAAELALDNLEIQHTRVRALRDKLECQILSRIPGAVRNGAAEPRLPNTTNIAFDPIEAEGLLLLLDDAGICASSGSACAAGSLDPSHVLTAMGCSAARARGSIRFSLGIESTEAEVDCLLKTLPEGIEKLKAAWQ